MFLCNNITSWLWIGLIGVFLCLIVKLFETSPVPNDIPWVLKRKGILGRAAERFIGVNPVGFIHEGYQKYSKYQKPFVLPSVTEGDEVLLPTDQSNSILFAAETKFSFKSNIMEFFQLKYTSWPLAFSEKYDLYVKVISKDLTETLKTESVAISLNEIYLYSAMEKMASRMINVLAIGPGHSRDNILLSAMTHCSNAIVFGASIIKAFPSFLHPIVGPFVGLVNRYFELVFHSRMKPIIESKVDEQQKAMYLDGRQETLKPKVGVLLDLLIQTGLRSKWPMEITSMCVLLDILSHPVEGKLTKLLQEEVESIAASSGGVWTAYNLGKASLLDSAVKESLRLNGINAASPTRKVVAPDGVTLANNLFLPYGTKVGIPQYALHRDEEFYPEPDKYNPYRFYTTNATAAERHQNGMTTTSDKFVVFGHGRRQCPGRWIFAHIFKVFIAEMLLNYDIQPIPVRPRIHRWGRFQLPPVTTRIAVRRRKSKAPIPV
ncbi:cytochrome P450 [Aspergillus ibericus CBS 121593]|uniref:Cytochrome P450 n=1 Tax=Aspergillus ibericus CBS 121593 TaxID=1448316 RepID=A0A395H7F6_9EURO|nr:cytochrome P450 [Aspergillus ibericus CBS 121593]RAL03847.1 cytochrome P450 [Aspergillus ibericus CBS 121593]